MQNEPPHDELSVHLLLSFRPRCWKTTPRTSAWSNATVIPKHRHPSDHSCSALLRAKAAFSPVSVEAITPPLTTHSVRVGSTSD